MCETLPKAQPLMRLPAATVFVNMYTMKPYSVKAKRWADRRGEARHVMRIDLFPERNVEMKSGGDKPAAHG